MCFRTDISLLLTVCSSPCSHPINIVDSKHLDNIIRRKSRSTNAPDNNASATYAINTIQSKIDGDTRWPTNNPNRHHCRTCIGTMRSPNELSLASR